MSCIRSRTRTWYPAIQISGIHLLKLKPFHVVIASISGLSATTARASRTPGPLTRSTTTSSTIYDRLTLRHLPCLIRFFKSVHSVIFYMKLIPFYVNITTLLTSQQLWGNEGSLLFLKIFENKKYCLNLHMNLLEMLRLKQTWIRSLPEAFSCNLCLVPICPRVSNNCPDSNLRIINIARSCVILNCLKFCLDKIMR